MRNEHIKPAADVPFLSGLFRPVGYTRPRQTRHADLNDQQFKALQRRRAKNKEARKSRVKNRRRR